MKKVCTKCREEKELRAFTNDASQKDGKRSECTVCSRAMKRRSHQKDPRQHLLRGCRKRAKDRNIPFSITKEDIIIPEVCPILGIPLKVASERAKDYSPTVDRIEPGLGYVPENIHVISARANRIKNDATPEELIKIGEYIKKFVLNKDNK